MVGSGAAIGKIDKTTGVNYFWTHKSSFAKFGQLYLFWCLDTGNANICVWGIKQDEQS